MSAEKVSTERWEVSYELDYLIPLVTNLINAGPWTNH